MKKKYIEPDIIVSHCEPSNLCVNTLATGGIGTAGGGNNDYDPGSGTPDDDGQGIIDWGGGSSSGDEVGAKPTWGYNPNWD